MRADGFDSLDDIHTLGDAAENNVLTVQPAGGGGAQEELGTVRARAGVGHGEDTRTGVLEGEVFILKLVTVDGLAAGTVVVGEVTALAHETRDHAVERRAFVAKALFARAERAEVFCMAEKSQSKRDYFSQYVVLSLARRLVSSKRRNISIKECTQTLAKASRARTVSLASRFTPEWEKGQKNDRSIDRR